MRMGSKGDIGKKWTVGGMGPPSVTAGDLSFHLTCASDLMSVNLPVPT